MIRQQRVILTVLALVLALGIRAGLLQSRAYFGPPPGTVGDEPDYQIRATNLALHGVYSRAFAPPLLPDALRPPGFSAVLAAVYRAGTPDPRVALVVVLLLNWATVALLAVSGRYVGPSTAAVAGLLLALDLNHAVSGVELLAESLCGLLVLVATVLLLASWRRRQDGPLLFASGLACGLAALIHGVLLLAPLPLLLANLIHYRPAWRRALAAGGLCLLGFIAATGPWSARNYALFGVPTVSIKAGEQLLLWYDAVVESKLSGLSFDDAQEKLYQQVRPQLRQGDQWQAYNDAVMGRAGVQLVKARPAATALACTRGFVGFFVAPNRQRLQRYLPPTGLWRLAWLPAAVLWSGVIALAGYGMLAGYRQSPALVVLLAGVTLSVALLTGPLGYGRFRVSVDPLLCMLAAVGLKRAWPYLCDTKAKWQRRYSSSSARIALGCSRNLYSL